MMSPDDPRLQYPQATPSGDVIHGLFPTDFLVEKILEEGLAWFRATPSAAQEVYGHLFSPLLAGRYGAAKVQEISDYIDGHEIRIIQAFPNDDTTLPTISIQLADGGEAAAFAGLHDYAGDETDTDTLGKVIGREEIGYMPFNDSIMVGIHAAGSPDKVKYLYYLVVYILSSRRREFEAAGMMNLTFRATDLSRLNEMLPSNVFSRYVTLSVMTHPKFKLGEAPIITGLNVNVKVGG
jgi:hypothetical protein